MRQHQVDKWIILATALVLYCCLYILLPATANAGTLTLPSGLKTIEEEAFYGDTSINEVVIPEGVVSIGSKAFANSGLHWIKIPSSVTYIANDAFAGCNRFGFINTPQNSYASLRFPYSVHNGIIAFSYTFMEPSVDKARWTVGYEFDIQTSNVFPSCEEVKYYTNSDSIEVDENGHIMVVQPGNAEILFSDSTGAVHTLVKTVVPDVFTMYLAGSRVLCVNGAPCVLSPNQKTRSWTVIPTGGSEESVETVRPQFRTFDYDILKIYKTNHGSWSVSIMDGAEWITLKVTSGTSDYICLPDIFEAAENNTGMSRAGHLLFTLGDYEYVYTIAQIVPVQSLTIDQPDMTTLVVGDRLPLTATVQPSKDYVDLVWSSSNESVASVSDNGIVVANAVGTVNVTLSSPNTELTDTIELNVIETLEEGSGSLSGDVKLASDERTAIQGAAVKLYHDGAQYRVLTTNQNGYYSANLLPAGIYEIRVSKDGFVQSNGYVTIYENENTYVETYLMVAGEAGQTGTVIGTITNAITSAQIPGAQFSFRSGYNNENGVVISEISADSSGRYSVTLPIGNYSVSVSADGYLTTSFNIAVQPDVISSYDFAITPAISMEQYRVILTWGTSPRDLDSHLVGKLSSGSDYHVCYWNEGWINDGTQQVCMLDVDDRDGKGPEVITLVPTTASPYYYYVYNYSKSPDIKTSGARVEIYKGSQLIRSYNVPTDKGNGQYWNVFALVNGHIITANTITDGKDDGNDADLNYANSNYHATSISGVVKLANGTPVQGIDVYVRAASEDLVSYSYTGADGKWTANGLESGASYQVYYGSLTYTVSGNGETYITGSSIQAVASLQAEQDDTISFTMKQEGNEVTSIEVGSSVDFEVTAPNAAYVRLVVDDKTYEAHQVVNGAASFSRMFASTGSGSRTVKIQAYTNEDGWIGVSAAKTLTVTKAENHDLTAPQLVVPGTSLIGSAVEISWPAVPNAQHYAVYVYGPGGTQMYPNWRDMEAETENPALSRTISGGVFGFSGTYSIQVVATGKGYESATGEKDIYIRETNENVVISLSDLYGSITVDDWVCIDVMSAFTGDYTYEITSSDPEHTVINGDNVSFSVAGTYTLSATLIYNGTTYQSNELTVNVTEPVAVEPEVVLKAEAVEDGVKKAYSSYCWEVVGTKITYRLTANFPISTVTVTHNGSDVSDMLEPVSEMVYTLEFTPTTANQKEEYIFSLTDAFGASYGPYSVPVYAMASNPANGQVYYLKRGVKRYEKPEDQQYLTPLTDYAKAAAGEGVYNGRILVKYKGVEYFVNAEDCLTEEQYSGGDGTLVIEHSFEGQIVYTTDQYTYTITANEGIKKVLAKVSFIPASQYASISAGTAVPLVIYKGECEPISGTTDRYTFPITFDQCGQYHVQFTPVAINDDLFPAQGGEEDVFSILHTSGTVYLYTQEYCDLYETPLCNSASGRIKYDMPLSVLGDAGNGMLYVQNGVYSGCIAEDVVKTYINEVEKKAYIIIGKIIIDQLNEIGNITAPGRYGEYVVKARELFKGNGCKAENIHYYVVTCDSFCTLIRDIGQETDFNDITYIYISCHGNVVNNEGVLTIEDADGDGTSERDEILWYADNPYSRYRGLCPLIADNFSGSVVLIMSVCHSGSIRRAINSTSNWDQARFSVIASAQADQSEYISLINGSPLMNELYNYYHDESIARRKSLIQVQEDVDNIWGSPFGASKPAFIGNYENIIFEN